MLAKVTTALPEALRGGVIDAPFFVSSGDAAIPAGVDLADLRRTIRETRKLRIAYVDSHGTRSDRTVWPIAMAYYVDVTVLGAWCELRGDFRVERIIASTVLDATFSTDGGRLMQRWFALQADRGPIA